LNAFKKGGLYDKKEGSSLAWEKGGRQKSGEGHYSRHSKGGNIIGAKGGGVKVRPGFFPGRKNIRQGKKKKGGDWKGGSHPAQLHSEGPQSGEKKKGAPSSKPMACKADAGSAMRLLARDQGLEWKEKSPLRGTTFFVWLGKKTQPAKERKRKKDRKEEGGGVGCEVIPSAPKKPRDIILRKGRKHLILVEKKQKTEEGGDKKNFRLVGGLKQKKEKKTTRVKKAGQ